MEMETGREQSTEQGKSIEQRIADMEERTAKDKKIMEQEFENFKKVFDEKTTLITEILDEGPAEDGSPSTQVQMTIQTKDKIYDIFWSHPEPAEAEDIDVVPMGDSEEEMDSLRVDLGFGPEEENDFSCPRLAMVSDFLRERYSVQELYDDCLKENYDGRWTHDPYRGWSFEKNEESEENE